MDSSKPSAKGGGSPAVFALFEKKKKASLTPEPLTIVSSHDSKKEVEGGARIEKIESPAPEVEQAANTLFSIFKKSDKTKQDSDVAANAPPNKTNPATPAPKPPIVNVIDLASGKPTPVAPLFMTKAMKEQQRMKENEESLQKSKERSKSLERALFGGTATGQGKSLNAVLMERSAFNRSPSLDSSVDGDVEPSQLQGKRIVFQEAIRFPTWQHVNAEEEVFSSSLIDWNGNGSICIDGSQVRIVDDKDLPIRQPYISIDVEDGNSHLAAREVIDLSESSLVKGQSNSRVESVDRDPIHLTTADLRALWVEYLTAGSCISPISSSEVVIDLSMTPNIDLSTNNDLLQQLRPRSSRDICGNKKAIRQFKRWLQEWVAIEEKRNKRRLSKGKGSCQKPKKVARRGDNYTSDIDSDFSDGEDEFSTIFILQGPSGCGKTSAVYACAEELGFEVKEENTCECRAGNAIKRRVHETSQSRSFGTTAAPSPANFFGGSSPGDAIPLERSTSKDMHKSKLILFDEADITFDDDAGMYRAIIQLSKETKCPIVLTTQRNLLLDSRTGLMSSKPAPTVAEMDFPSQAEASEFVQAAVASMNSLKILSVSPSKDDIDILCDICRCDLRQSILTLQLLVGPVKPMTVVARSENFLSWLQTRHSLQAPWLDFLSGSNMIQPYEASTSNEEAESLLNATVHPPVLMRLEPALIDPASPFTLHVHGYNFLQRKQRHNGSDNNDTSYLPLYLWLCCERFVCNTIHDNLAIASVSLNKGVFWSGSQEVTLQVGDGISSGGAFNSIEFIRGVVPLFDDISPPLNPSHMSKRLFVCLRDPNSINASSMAGKSKKAALLLIQKPVPRRLSGNLAVKTPTDAVELINDDFVEVTPASNRAPTVSGKRPRRQQVLGDDDTTSKPADTGAVPSSKAVDTAAPIIDEKTEESWSNEIDTDATLETKKKFCLDILDRLSSDPECYPFLEPVDSNAYPDYRLYVNHPMDLGTVRESVIEGVYNVSKHGGLKKLRRRKTETQEKDQDETIDIASFISDVRLVWSNCEIYNDLNSEIVGISRRLSNLFEECLEGHKSTLLRVFAYDYIPPPSRSRKAKSLFPPVSSFSKEEKSTSAQTIPDKNIEPIKTKAPIVPATELPANLSDSSSDEGEWSDESETVSARATTDTVATSILPSIEVPTKGVLNALLDSAEQERKERVSEYSNWASKAASLCSNPNLPRLLTAVVCNSSTTTELSHLENLSSRADLWSDLDVLQSAFDEYYPGGESLFTTSHQSLGVECIDDFPLDDDLDTQIIERESEPAPAETATLFGGAKPQSRYDLIGPRMFLEDSSWSAASITTHRYRRLSYASNESNNSFVTARPFSTVDWNNGWSGVEDVVTEMKKIANKQYSVSIADVNDHKHWKLMKGRSALLAWIHENYPLGSSVAHIFYSFVFSNRINRWSISQELILDGLPMLRAMLLAESSNEEKGGNSAMTGSRRSSRRMASSMRFHHLALCTGKSDAVLAELMDLGRCHVNKM